MQFGTPFLSKNHPKSKYAPALELDDVARNMVKTLKDIGVEISLDDFGTGYTSLNHLAALPLDILKIDKSFIDKLEENPKLVDSILQLADAFNLQVIAEGVETQSQLLTLIQKGCHMAQGYFLSRPISQEALFALLEESPDIECWEPAIDENPSQSACITAEIQYLRPIPGGERYRS